MATKFGLPPGSDAANLVLGAVQLLGKYRIDYTIFMRGLCEFDSTDGALSPQGGGRRGPNGCAVTLSLNSPLRDLFPDRDAFDAWAQQYAAALRLHALPDAERRQAMLQVNPKFILRNHLAEVAIRRAADHRDYSEIERLYALLAKPYEEHPGFEAYAQQPPDWAKQIEVSCSS